MIVVNKLSRCVWCVLCWCFTRWALRCAQCVLSRVFYQGTIRRGVITTTCIRCLVSLHQLQYMLWPHRMDLVNTEPLMQCQHGNTWSPHRRCREQASKWTTDPEVKSEPPVWVFVSYHMTLCESLSPITWRYESLSPITWRYESLSPITWRCESLSPITWRCESLSPITWCCESLSPITWRCESLSPITWCLLRCSFFGGGSTDTLNGVLTVFTCTWPLTPKKGQMWVGLKGCSFWGLWNTVLSGGGGGGGGLCYIMWCGLCCWGASR